MRALTATAFAAAMLACCPGARAAPLAAVALAAAAAAGAPLPAAVATHLPHARLAGAGAFTWFTLAIYDAQLWVGAEGYSAAAPLAAPFVLDLTYARKLEGARIATASIEQIDKAGSATPAQRATWLATMQAIFPDVREGSRISGVYVPGAGTRFYLDGAPIGSVADPDFARAFFGIWLGPATTAPALRAALLKDAAPR